MSFLIPTADKGYLPYFLLYVSDPTEVAHFKLTIQDGLAAVIHAVVCYLTPPQAALKQFSGRNAPPPHPLLAHTYGVKNIYTGAIRLYAAYTIGVEQHFGSSHGAQNQALYDLSMLSFVGVLWLYGGERFIYGSCRNVDVMFPFTLAGSGLIWMLMQRSYYLA